MGTISKHQKEVNESMGYSSRYIPAAQHLLGEIWFPEATPEQDKKENTDLTILTFTHERQIQRIAFRVRANRYWYLHKDEITIRCSRPGNVKTELEKILEGFGDAFLYCFAAREGIAFAGYYLCDLNVFRRWYIEFRVRNPDKEPGILCTNPDGSSKFRAYKVNQFPKEFVIATNININIVNQQG